ncbi:MAG: A/G-specific adenine glycosylase [Candidatus Marinimicrobia bacterium]|nr:A/G-specific adenine glycosylase [Candidatus Neomarinimicrobiota bacterium]
METFSNRLIKWHKRHGRKDLPWQINKSPYKVWISEIMLQQTQVKTAIPYFERFIKKFPDISSLAKGGQDDVLSQWSGLGYYARARNLHKTAIILERDFNSLLPSSLDQLMNLPGIGRSTAGAILSLGFNKKAPILDGNVKRVIARYKNIDGDITNNKTLNHLWEITEELQPKKDFSTYNQSIMDLGATICKRRNPLCDQCPLSQDCLARRNDSIHLLPFKEQRQKKQLKKVFWLLPYTQNGHIYLRKRDSSGLWGGLWTFIENQDFEDLCKEINKLLPYIDQKLIRKYSTITHSFSHYNLEADLYLLEIVNSSSNKNWKKINELDSLGMPKPITEALRKIEENGKISIL